MKKESLKSTYTVFSAIITLLTFGMATFLTFFVASVLAVIGVFLFSKQKVRKWITLAVAIGFNIFTSATIGVPVRYSYPMAGEVHDKLTGEPIENAIFECRWVGREDILIGSHAGFDIDQTYAVTDNNGRYFLKGRWTFDLFYPTVSRYVTLRHPLYETISSIDLKWNKLNEGDTKIKPEKGIIPYSIKLIKLEDKYRATRDAGGTDITWVLHDEMIPYATQAQKLDLVLDWQTIFTKWDNILKPFGEYKGTTKSEITRITGRGAQ